MVKSVRKPIIKRDIDNYKSNKVTLQRRGAKNAKVSGV